MGHDANNGDNNSYKPKNDNDKKKFVGKDADSSLDSTDVRGGGVKKKPIKFQDANMFSILKTEK